MEAENALYRKRSWNRTNNVYSRYYKKLERWNIINIFCWQCFDFDIGRYDNVAAWYNRCKQLLDKFGFEDVHGPGTKMFTELYQANLGKSS